MRDFESMQSDKLAKVSRWVCFVQEHIDLRRFYSWFLALVTLMLPPCDKDVMFQGGLAAALRHSSCRSFENGNMFIPGC